MVYSNSEPYGTALVKVERCSFWEFKGPGFKVYGLGRGVFRDHGSHKLNPLCLCGVDLRMGFEGYFFARWTGGGGKAG